MTTEATVGTAYEVSVGTLTQKDCEKIGQRLAYQSAIELAESSMNLMGGSWREPYTCNGRHFYQMSEYDEYIPEGARYVFINRLPFFGQQGTH